MKIVSTSGLVEEAITPQEAVALASALYIAALHSRGMDGAQDVVPLLETLAKKVSRVVDEEARHFDTSHLN